MVESKASKFRCSTAICLNVQQLCKGEHPPAVVKIVCNDPCEVRITPCHDTECFGSLTTTIPEAGKETGVLRLQATVWTRRPLWDKPPIDRHLTVRARGGFKAVAHTHLLLSVLDHAVPWTSTDARLLDYDLNQIGLGAVGPHRFKPKSLWAQKAQLLLLACCWASLDADIDTCKCVLTHWLSVCPTNLKTWASVYLLIWPCLRDPVELPPSENWHWIPARNTHKNQAAVWENPLRELFNFSWPLQSWSSMFAGCYTLSTTMSVSPSQKR